MNSLVRGMGYGLGRQLVYRAAHSNQMAQHSLASTVLANRRALLSLGYLTPELVIAYAGDRVRYLDTSHGSAVMVEGEIIGVGRRRILIRLPLARGGSVRRWADPAFVEVLPRPADTSPPPPLLPWSSSRLVDNWGEG